MIHDDYISEGYALEDSVSHTELAEIRSLLNSPSISDMIEVVKKRYEKAKKAKTGSDIECPSCLKNIKKTTYNKVFCCNKCKDKYWNNVDEKRRARAIGYSR